MAKVEKHRSSRKSGHRKRNDGGYSDTETDREVSSLTDRAFRSLCIGDEAVYNDSDLCASPCKKRDTDTLKRTAHESFSLRVQQYGQDWMYRGMYGAEIHKDHQWGMYGESGAQERLSSSYQSSVEAHQQETHPRELSLFSNGTTEVSSQQRRSNSRVSSLVRAFNSEGQGDEAMYNDETSWDKSALMSIERELSEFSPYPQNMNTGYFPSTGLFSSQNTNYYSSDVAAQMNSASTFMRSSHSMSTEVNSNFFIHSEFSPFKVWRDQNRFPFQGGQVSGFLPRSEFQKWYETPMYKELSLQPQQHPSMFSQGYQRNTFAPAIPMNPQRSTSASTMMQRASAVEKRCELELAGQYRKRAQSTGANRLPPQRPSTASPASDMSRRVRDTISSVKSLQHKIKMMAEQNLETQSQEGFSNNNYMNSYDPMVNNMVSSIPYAAPYQMQKPHIYQPSAQQQLLQQHSVSPQPVEHAPVRAESRGATPDIKMSSYKSRAASLLYNLKDNRMRVKATYSPNAYQGLEKQEIYKQEPKDCVIDVPELSASELSNSTDGRVNRLDVPKYGYQPHHPGMHTQSSQKSFENPIDMSKFNVTQYGYQVCSSGMQHNSQHLQYSQSEFGNSVENSMLHIPQYGYYKPHSPGMLQNSQYKLAIPMEGGMRLDVGQYGYQAHSPGMQQNMQFPQFTQNMQNTQQHYLGQSSSEYYRAQMQGEMAPHHGFSGYTPEYYANTQLANGQNPYENISSFTPYKQSLSDKGEGSYANWLEQNTEVQRFGPVVQSRDYVSKDNSRQQFNEAASGEYTGVDRYNQVKENKYDYNNVNSQDMWGQTNSRQIQKPAIPSAQNYQNINAYPRNSQENMLNYQHEQKAMDNYATRPQGTFNGSNQMLQQAPPHPANTGNAGYNTQPQPGTYRDIYAPPTSHKVNKEIKMKENYAPQDNHKYYDQESKKQTIISGQAGMLIATEELVQRKGEAIKEIGIKGTRDFGNSKQEGKIDKEKLKDISTGDLATNDQVSFQQNKTEDQFAEDRRLHDKDLPTAEDLIKQLRGENSPNINDVEVEKVTDKQEHMTYIEPQKREPETQQLIVEPANTEELKEEPIKCELATSSEEARIEQVKPEPSREERVITEEATESQVGEENVAIEEDRNEAKQAATEQLMECQGNTKHVEYKDIDISVEEQKLPQKKKEKEADAIANAAQIPKEDTTITNYVESLSNSNKPETSEPDKVKLTKTKPESATLKVIIKDGQTVKKGEEHTEQDNYNVSLLSREPQFQMQNEDFTDRGADYFENIKEKYGYSQDTSRNETSTTSTAHEQETTAGKKDQIKENKVDTNHDKQKVGEVLSKTTENSEKVGNPHDDPAGSQYVYSETSKDFKLSVSGVPDTKDICEKVTIKDVPIENINKSDASQKKDHAKQQHNKSEMSERNVPNLTDKRTLHKNDACLQDNLTVNKLDKPSISKQKEVAKQVHMERKTKSIDQKAGTSKEMIKGLIQREKAQTKQEMLTSKIKAHAEKEISAIKEGFAVKDGLKNPSKALAIGQNVTIRQKPPSQEVLRKQDRLMSNNISKEFQSQTAVSATGALPPENGNASLKMSTATNMELTESKTTSLKMTTNDTVNNEKKCGYPTDGKTVKSQPDDKSLKQDSLSKRCEVDQAIHENKTPLQLQNDISEQDKSLEMMNIMVTVREQKPEKVESQGQAEVLSAEDHHVVETTIKSHSDKVSDSQDYNKTTHDTRDDYSVTAMESAVKNLTDKTSEECPQQECSLPNERPQSEILLSDHLVVPRTVTVPAKNNLLAETQHPTSKQDTISVETKVYANKPPNVVLESTLIKGQEEPTREMNLKSVSVTSNEDTQEDTLHIDCIAVRVVPVVTEEANKAQQRTVSNTSGTEDETQKCVPSNDDVQKVISSVRKQAQLLKNSKQSKLDNTRTSNESDNHRNVDETEILSNEEGYFQVDNRETVPQKCTNVEQSSENVSQESKPSSTITKYEIIKMSKETGNTQIDTKNKDEKVVAGNTRRHHMANGRQRGVLTPHERPDNNVEVKPKPKVPIPEISALADYARLKVIVSKDDEDSILEQPPHKKEGFFPLIQSRHSRRPVFTVDSQEDAVKGKGSQDQSEAQVKVSKEPATVVIPITEKQPQRDMFKLGAKENPEVQERKPTELTSKNTEDRIKHMLEKSRAKQVEEDKRAAQREEERRACEREAIAAQIRERRKKQREAERYAEEEGRGKVVEQQIHLGPEQKGKVMSTENEDKQKLFEKDKTAERNPDENIRAVQNQNSDAHKAEGKSHVLEGHKEEQRKDYLEEPNKNTTHIEEQKSRKLLEERQRKTEEQKKKDILEEQQRRVQMEEQKKRLVLEEQRKRAALEEQEKQAANTEGQTRIVAKEELRKVTLEENTRKAFEEQQRQAKAAEIAQTEQQKRRVFLEEAAPEKKMADEPTGQQRQAALITEQKKRVAIMAHEEKQKPATLEEQQRRAAEKEQLRKIAEKEQYRQSAILEEQKKRAAVEEQQKKVAQEEKQRQAALKEKEQRAALEEQQRRAAEKEKQRKMAAEEQQRRAAREEKLRRDALIEEQKRKAVAEEQQRRAAREEQLRKAAVIEEQKRKAAVEEEQKRRAEEKQREAEEGQKRKAAEEEQRKTAEIEKIRKQAAHKEQLRKMAEEEQLQKAEQEKAALEEQKRRAAHEEQLRKAEEQKRRAAAEEEQKRRAAAEEEQKRRAAVEEEQKRKAAAEEEQKRRAAVEEEQKRRAAVEEEQKRRAAVEEEQKRRAAVEEEQKRRAAVEEEQKRRAAVEEEQKRRAAAEEEQKRRAEEKQRKAEEQQRKAEEEQKRKAQIEEQKRKSAEEEQRKSAEIEKIRKQAAHKEQLRKMAEEEHLQKAEQEKAALEEQQRRAAQEEQLRKAEEQKRRAEEEQKRKTAEIEQRKTAEIEEKKRQAAHKERLRKMAEEEQRQKAEQEKAALEEQQRRAAEEKQRKMAEEEQQRRAAEEKQKKMAEEEQQRRAAEEKQKKMAEEEQQRRAAEEKQKKMAEEEQQRRAAVEEDQKRKAAAEEQQRRAAREEQLRKNKIAEEEEQRKALIEEQRRQAAHEEQLRKMAEEEQRQTAEQEKAALEEQLRKAEEQKRKAAVEEEQRRRKAVEEEQKRRAAVEEEQKRRKAVEEEQNRRKAVEEEKKRRAAVEEEQNRRAAAEEEQKRRAAVEEEQKKRAAAEEEQKRRKAAEEEQKKKAQIEEQKRKAAEEEQRKTAEIEKMRKQAAHKEQLRKMAEEEQLQKAEQEKAALEEQQRRAAQEEQLRKAAVIEEQKRKAAVKEEQQRKAQIEEQRQISAEEEARRNNVQVKKQRRTRQEEEETQLAYIREERIKRQIEEEKEAQIEEERSRRQQSSEENPTYKGKAQPWSQKDTRTRPVVSQEGTDETEREKYTFETTEALQYYSLTSEKASPPQKRSNTNESETVEDARRPHSLVSPVPSLPRSSASSPAFGMKPSMFKVKDNTSRGTSLTKSIKPRFHKNFGEEYRVGSPMDRGWERNESDQDRCRTPSTPLPQHRPFSRRSLALDEEDSRSVISNMSEDVDSVATSAADLADIRGLYDSDRPESACSYSSDVSRSFGKPPAVPPKSEKGLRRAKRLATRRRKKELSKDVTDDSCEAAMSEDTSNDVVASPHFTRPISIARVPPAGSSLSLSHSEQSQKSIHTAPHVSPHTSTPQVTSSPTPHHVPKPVTQYQVESGFSQPYTQKRVMQDVGSGQYYVVDVPVEVKTKTFFDPETGKYVQLKVRESSRNATQRQPLQGYPQGHLKPKLQANPQPIPANNAQYQSYPSNHKGYQSATTSSGPVNQSMTPATRDQRMTGYSYNSDKTPYMDTVNNVDKPHHVIYNTQGSQGAISEGDDQLVNSRYAKRDIIKMSELEDFMEVSDW